MENDERQKCQPPRHSRKTLRLTFSVSNGTVKLVSHECLQMITPPQVGELPKAGKHGGFWIELRDAKNRVLAHRLISPTQLNSVEIHSPDGKIEREFGEVKEGVFEVLLPDEDDAEFVVLMGDQLVLTKGKAKRSEASGELAQFKIPGRVKGGEK
jgi:hypothetical protein